MERKSRVMGGGWLLRHKHAEHRGWAAPLRQREFVFCRERDVKKYFTRLVQLEAFRSSFVFNHTKKQTE
jgi:hypothetical protein